MDLVVVDHRQITQLISHSFSSNFSSSNGRPRFSFRARERIEKRQTAGKTEREEREREKDETQCARERVLRVWEKGKNERERVGRGNEGEGKFSSS